jgi:hypothetical protein
MRADLSHYSLMPMSYCTPHLCMGVWLRTGGDGMMTAWFVSNRVLIMGWCGMWIRTYAVTMEHSQTAHDVGGFLCCL